MSAVSQFFYSTHAKVFNSVSSAIKANDISLASRILSVKKAKLETEFESMFLPHKIEAAVSNLKGLGPLGSDTAVDIVRVQIQTKHKTYDKYRQYESQITEKNASRLNTLISSLHEQSSLRTEGIFRKSSNEGPVHSTAQQIKNLLPKSLSEAENKNIQHQISICKGGVTPNLNGLPSPLKNVIDLCKAVVKESEYNKMGANNLSRVIAPHFAIHSEDMAEALENNNIAIEFIGKCITGQGKTTGNNTNLL